MVWRAGLDLNPLDLSDDDEVKWLEALAEGPQNIPGVPPHVANEHRDRDAFLLCVDGRPTAWTDGHGTWIEWRRQSR